MLKQSRLRVRRVLLALAVAAGASWTPPAAAEHPNFVFFLADDLGWRDLGCQGSPRFPTGAKTSLPPVATATESAK